MKRNKTNTLAYPDAFIAGRLGIRNRMLIQLALLVAFILSLVWVCQIAMLMGFYESYRSSQVREAAHVILQNIDHDDLEELADRISAEKEVCMPMVDEGGEELLSIDHVRFCLLHRMKKRELQALMERTPQDGTEIVERTSVAPFRNENYHPEVFEGEVPVDQASSGRNMIYSRKVFFEDGSAGYLMINAQLTPTKTIRSMLKRQFLFIFIFIAVTTAVIGFMMAESISRPIIETNRAARALSWGEYTRPAWGGGYREIAELNDTLVQAADDLKRVEDLEKELIANISHDLRTPLTMIQGYAETMRDIPDEMNPENMQVIIDETHRLASLVNEVMEFSRLRAGGQQLTLSEFDLTETVKTICQRVGAMTEKDGYRVICQAEESHMVRGDPARIEQVVYNLLGNALTYTGEDRQVILREEEQEKTVRVSISDSGKGIAPEELPYIWDRYYRTKESHRRAVIGSGLGLNICRSILESHRVNYGVDSVPGKGTTFWFELGKA